MAIALSLNRPPPPSPAPSSFRAGIVNCGARKGNHLRGQRKRAPRGALGLRRGGNCMTEPNRTEPTASGNPTASCLTPGTLARDVRTGEPLST